MIFEYNEERVLQSSIDIDDIGNTAIEGTNDDGYYYYLIIVTVLGETSIYTFGPLLPDLAELIEGYTFNFFSLDYKENKIEKIITRWLNDNKKLTSAKIIDKQSAIDSLPNLEDIIQ